MLSAPLRPRDHLRALFVVFHVAAVFLLSLPSPGRLSKKHLKVPGIVETLDGVTVVLRVVVGPTSREELSEQILLTARSLQSTRRKLLSPFQRYRRFAGVGQGWTMFGVANRHPGRMEVYIRNRDAPEWLPIYVSRDPLLDWRSRQLDEERIRTLINNFSWGRGRRDWSLWVDWLAASAAQDFPEAISIKAQMVSMRLPSPAELRETGVLIDDKVYWLEERSLDALRSAARP